MFKIRLSDKFLENALFHIYSLGMTRLILTTVLAILFTVMGWLTIKTYADNKPHETRNVPFFTESFEQVAQNSITKEELDALVKTNPKVILKIPIQFTIDHEPVVYEHESIAGFGPIWKKTFSEIQKQDPKILNLKDIFKNYPKQRLVLHLGQKYTELSTSVYNLIKDNDAFERVIVSCDFNQPLQYLRKLDPRIFTSASVDEVLRLNSLISVQLQGLDSMKADLYIVPLQNRGLKIFSQNFVQEVHKRGKKIYVELETPNELSTIKNHGADGVLTRFILDKK